MFYRYVKWFSLLGLCLVLVGCHPQKDTVETAPSSSSRQTSSSRSLGSRSARQPSSSSSVQHQSSEKASKESSSGASSAMAQEKSKSSTTKGSTKQESSSSSSSADEGATKTEASSAPAPEMVGVPQGVVGVWEYQGQLNKTTVTIGADGLVTNQLVYTDSNAYGEVVQEQLGQFVKVTDSLYRLPDQAGGLSLMPTSGFGGSGIKFIIGLYLAPDGILYPQLWTMPYDADANAYDYANNVQTNWPMTRVN